MLSSELIYHGCVSQYDYRVILNTANVLLHEKFSRFIFYYQSQDPRGNRPIARLGIADPSKRQNHLLPSLEDYQ